MYKNTGNWEYTVLDIATSKELGCLGVEDFDGDGYTEIVSGGFNGLFWYRPGTFEKGRIADIRCHVGLAFEDIDGDGIKEVFTGEAIERDKEKFCIAWYKPGDRLDAPWKRHLVEPLFEGGPHDIIFRDVDGDGENELIATACYSSTPGIFIYKKNSDITMPWQKFCIANGVFAEGLSAGDVNGDGRLEIVCGPYLYTAPVDGPFSGQWDRVTYAQDFREMCKTSVIDITGDGRPDIIIAESEYMDGCISWFENRMREDPKNPWVEHIIDEGLIYAHSMNAWYDSKEEEVHVFTAEMAEGGWNAPYNYTARLIDYSTSDKGNTWNTDNIYKGEGTHQAVMVDIDGDGAREVVGEGCSNPKVQLWKKREEKTFTAEFKHRLLDLQKPYTATDMLTYDIDGDGFNDIACGSWWYKNPTWERYDIPGIYQVVTAYDIDGDGIQELIATKRRGVTPPDWYFDISSRLYWLKPIDPVHGLWEEYYIGEGHGDWPHGTVIAPFLPGGRLAFIAGYHNAGKNVYPEIFQIPDDPRQPWPKKIIAPIPYGEEMVACDINGDGRLDIAAGEYWLENMGDGSFKAHHVTAGNFKAARLAVMDVNGDGRPDMIMGEEELDYPNKKLPFSRLAWFENPGGGAEGPWEMHLIDLVRCTHSIGIGDFDGDGEIEIICGEHDPFRPYRSRCRVYAYKKAEASGKAWTRHTIDEKFEHHNGTRVFEVAPGRLAIASHGWQDNIYVHLWEINAGKGNQ